MTPERLAEIRARLDAATIGPWWSIEKVSDAVFIPAAPADVVDLIAHIDALTAERDELAATLANERGEGEPPSEGWTRNDFDHAAAGLAWYRPVERDGSTAKEGSTEYPWVLWVFRKPGGEAWVWERDHSDSTRQSDDGEAPTARAAMRAADAAVPRSTTAPEVPDAR